MNARLVRAKRELGISGAPTPIPVGKCQSRLTVLTLPTLHPHAAELRDAILNKLTYSCSKTPSNAGPYDWYLATVLAVRDRMVDRWLESEQRDRAQARQARVLPLDRIPDRAAAVRLADQPAPARRPRARRWPASTSISTSSASSSPTQRSATAASAGSPPATWTAWRRSAVPAYGYGIRYEHGLFMQQIRDGWQHELPERWLAFGNPWEFERLETEYSIRFGGSVEYVGGDRTARRAACGIRPSGCSRSRTTRRSPAGAAATSTRCGCGRRARPRRCISPRSTTGDVCRRHRAARAGRGDFARALSERRDAGGTGAAAAPGVFLHLGVAAGHRAAAICSSSTICTRCPTTSRSSSTTPIRRSRSPS